MRKLASRLQVMSGEGALAVFARAKELERQGRSIIHLELGEPDFHPAAPVVDAARVAIADGRDRYVASRGLPALCEAIAEYLGRTRDVKVAADQVLVTPGCKPALVLAMMALIEPGDEVLYPDPGFPIYPSMTRGLGATPVAYRLLAENRLQPDPDEIAARITPRTSVLLMNSPNNPTGTVYDAASLRSIAELALRHDFYIIADEIYARIVFSGAYQSVWLQPKMGERTVIVDGFSKSFAMTGWRLGYAVASRTIIDALDLLVVNSFTSTAEFTQVAAIEALRDSTNVVNAMLAQYLHRRDLFVNGLNRIPGFRCALPDGAFYAWLNIEDTGLSEAEFCRILLEDAGVAAIPGTAFGPTGKHFVRFSLASAVHLLEEAVARMEKISSRWSAAAQRNAENTTR
jgi:aspartate aminotransferase